MLTVAFFIVMLNVIILSVMILKVVMPSVVMLSVVAPFIRIIVIGKVCHGKLSTTGTLAVLAWGS